MAHNLTRGFLNSDDWRLLYILTTYENGKSVTCKTKYINTNSRLLVISINNIKNKNEQILLSFHINV